MPDNSAHFGNYEGHGTPYVGEDNAADWPDSQDAYWPKVMDWTESVYEEAVRDYESVDEYKAVARQIDYIRGKQWPAGRPRYKSKPVNNKVDRYFEELVGLLTDIRPITSVKVSRGNENSQALTRQAEIYNNCIRSLWYNSRVEVSLTFAIMYALLSTAYLKVEWNPRLRNGMGDFEIVPLGVQNVLPIKSQSTDIQTAECVVCQDVKPLSFFRERYPLRGTLVRPDEHYSRQGAAIMTPRSLSPQLFNGLPPQLQRIVGSPQQGTASQFPMALYREFWFRDNTRNASDAPVMMGDQTKNWGYVVEPGAPLYPRGRLIVKGGRTVLYDGPNPWWHGQYPLSRLRLKPVPWQSAGMSTVASWLPMQDIINNVGAGILDMIKKALNPVLMAPNNALSPESWKQFDPAAPGGKLGYSPLAREKPGFANPPALPPFVLQYMQKIDRDWAEQSGMAIISQMVSKKQVPGGDTFDQVRNAQNTPIRLKGRWIELVLEDLGRLILPSIPQMYSAGRRIMMFGLSGATSEDFELDSGSMIPTDWSGQGFRPEDYMRQFEFSVQPNSLLKINGGDNIAALAALRKNGDLDRKTMIEALNRDMNLGLDPEVIQENLIHEAKAMAAAGIQPPAHKGGHK